MIRYQSLTVTEMIEASSENPEYRNLDFIQKLAVLLDTEHDVHEIWQKCVSDSSVLGSDEKELMFSFGNMLGKSDTGGQISSIKIYKKRLEFLLEKFRNEYERKGRMYRSAGLLLGIMTGIVLL